MKITQNDIAVVFTRSDRNVRLSLNHASIAMNAIKFFLFSSIFLQCIYKNKNDDY